MGSPRHLNLVRYESTVGAGLPAVAALARLAAANDPVRRVRGVSREDANRRALSLSLLSNVRARAKARFGLSRGCL